MADVIQRTFPGGKTYNFPPTWSKEKAVRALVSEGIMEADDFKGQREWANAPWEGDVVPDWEGREPTGIESNIMRQEERSRDRQEHMSKREQEFPQEVRDIGTSLEENKLAIGGGIIGGLSPIPGGAALFSAVGAAGDSALKTYGKTGKVDGWDAAVDGVISLVVDAGLGGIARITPGVKQWVKAQLNAGLAPEEVAKELMKREGGEVTEGIAELGTIEGKKQAQETLQMATQGEAGLTLRQAGSEAPFDKWREAFGKGGMWSAGVFEANQKRVSEMTKNVLNSMFKSREKNILGESVAKNFTDNVNQANGLLYSHYKASIESMQATLAKGGHANVSAQPFQDGVMQWLKDNTNLAGISTLDDASQKLAQKLLKDYEGASFPPGHLLEIHKMINRQVGALGTFGSASFNPQAARELNGLADVFKGISHKQLGKVDSTISNQYRRVLDQYGTSKNALMPDITSDFVKRIDKQGLEQLADMFSVNTSNAQTVREAFKALDEAYSVTMRTTTKKQRAGMKIQTATEAKNRIRKRYLEQTLTDLRGTSVDPSDFAAAAGTLKRNPDKAATVAAILGPDLNRGYRKLLNAAGSTGDWQNLGEGALVLKGMEMKQPGEVVQAFLKPDDPSILIRALGGMAAVFQIPRMFAEASINGKAVNKLVGLQKIYKKSGKFTAKQRSAALTIANDLYKGLDDEDKEIVAGQLSSMVGNE